jgi:hypothetical protein
MGKCIFKRGSTRNKLSVLHPALIGGGMQMVETLQYKPESRGFDSRWCHWNFSLT